MKKKIFYILPLAVAMALISFKSFVNKPAAADVADAIFINGKIITVDSANSIQQAVAVKDGKILAVGSTADITKLKSASTMVTDLGGKTMIPGIVDGHSHFMSGMSRSQSVDLSPPPVGNVKSIPDIIAAIKAFIATNHVQKGEWINGFGYDQDQLVEKRHPTKEDLDAAFPDNPIVISHVSGHMAVVNSAALKLSGITSSTPNPPGGMIVRKPGTTEPAGLLQENARRLLKHDGGTKGTLDDELKLLKAEEDYYASYGITTAQDGYTSYESVVLLKEAAKRNDLFIDIDALPGFPILDSLIGKPQYQFGVYDNHLKLAGFKMIADGSPQGKTAFFTKPYLTPVPGCEVDDCDGIPVVTQEYFNDAVNKGFKNNIRVFVHCNGDATIDMYIKAVEKANQDLHTTSTDRRPVIIHSQFVRRDQLDKYKELGMLPSFFTNHAYFWGDVHVQNLGKERAFFLSPTKTALKKGIVFTNHTDFGVTPLNQMFVLWTSIARESRSGQVIGPDERLTPMEALRAITINGAYEYMEEKTKGSIEKGKLADLAVLSADPLTVPTTQIKDISVLQTIKEGKTIYKR